MADVVAIFACGLAGALLLGLLGFLLGVPIGSLIYAPPPPRSPVGAIWALTGGLSGAFFGFFAGALWSLLRLGYGKN
jgi:hypothetical protein